MRRTATILLGLMLIVGSVGVFSYRWFVEPSATSVSSRAPVATRSVQPSARSADREAVRRPEPAINGVRLFEIVLNTLNAVVGVVGIWVGLMGLRMRGR